MAVAEAGLAKFNIGRVVNRVFGVISRNPTTFLVLSLLAAVPQAVFFSGILPYRVGGVVRTPHFSAVELTTLLISAVAWFVGVYVLQAALVYGTVSDLNGRRAGIADCLLVGLKSFLPIFAITFLMGLGVGFAALLLIFPAFMLAMAWLVVIPVYIVERPGILASFGRSRALTRGYRWPLFGLVIVYSIANSMFQAAMTPLTSGSILPGDMLGTDVALLTSTLVYGAAAMVSATGIASIYYELRVLKEGIGPEALAAIFD